ncbi:MAG: esterase YqiA [Gammaproteobacteria bacterium]|nr:MAG: esterase YqiA [Gammaproteobacteria bacterium]RLA49869.1 MAG: esterase YqiA [Gammaproteobacteria bacterium]
MTSLLYIHGFNSSPDSTKARQTRDWLAAQLPAVDFICPFLSPFPSLAMAKLESILESIPKLTKTSLAPVVLIGSSMGGYYATWLAEKYACKAVLVNPAVRPWLGREYLLGDQENYHTGEVSRIEQGHLDQLQEFDVAILSEPARFMVLVQSGDEVLDYRQAAEKYAACKLLIEEGGDHSFQGYEHHLADVIEFLTKPA